MKNRTTSRGIVEERRGGTASRAHAPPLRLFLTLLLDVVLVSACETGIKPTAVVTAADSADQVLFNMSHYVTADGIQRAHVLADTAYFYSPTQTAELRNVHITFFDQRGAQTSTLTSREGTYHWQTGDMEARGDVVVVRTDSATLRTAVIRYSQSRNQVSSDQIFVFDEPGGQHIVGQGFTSDPDFKVVTALKPVGRGGTFTLPNQ
jgi:LPS export ABC transporter protein LptC